LQYLKLITIVITRRNRVNMEKLGKRLKTAREKAGLSQRQLANESGVSQGMISQIEAGHKEGGIRTLEKLAEALGMRFEDLYRGEAPTGDADLLKDKLVYEIAQTVKPMTVREKKEVLRFSKFVGRRHAN